VVVPLTSSTSRQYPGEVLVTVAGTQSKVMVDQIMVADKTRLKSQLGGLSKADILAVEAAILLHLGMPK
jgi:mRNA interferase MazF